MVEDQKIYTASQPLEPGDRYGILSGFDPGTTVLPAGFRIAPQFAELPVDIVFERDVPVTLRDGAMIHVDLFRPVGQEPVPVIVAWSPYGKGQGTSASVMGAFGLVGLPNSIVSGLEKFEGPDLAYWCAQGYAVCNPDIRGVAESDGDSVLWDRQEGRDCCDLIEWLGVQEWCSGRVGMSGTSYLAVAQWFAAAEQPPHLAAVNPWEGVSDVYRDLALRGGMPDDGFAATLQRNSFWGRSRKEDILTEIRQHPLMDPLWEQKIPDFEKITVPAYVVASWSNTLHTQGTFRAWRRIGSAQKWLRVHRTQEWPDYYDEANREELRLFFDRFLKDEGNGWETTPRVRYSVLDLEGGDEEAVPSEQFPPAEVESVRCYLDAGSRSLVLQAPVDESEAVWTAGGNPDLVSFLMDFDRETVLVGYPKARLWVEARDATDMDLFVLLQKLDAQGTPLAEFTVPNRSARLHDVTERGASILRYRGADGRLRASMRALDEQLSTDEVPAHRFDRAEKLTPGDVVEVEIDMLPVGLRFHPGEQLRLVLSGRSLLGPMMPGTKEHVSISSGRQVVHTGGARASYLQVPVRRD